MSKIHDSTWKESDPGFAPSRRLRRGCWCGLRAACDWELNRRAGLDYPLQPPEAAIPPQEDAVSIDAALAMRATFAQDSLTVLGLFDALVELLTGGGSRNTNRDLVLQAMTGSGQLETFLHSLDSGRTATMETKSLLPADYYGDAERGFFRETACRESVARLAVKVSCASPTHRRTRASDGCTPTANGQRWQIRSAAMS